MLEVTLIGVHDNFFALGGHSLLATQVISRIREAFAVELALRALFEYSCIAELAEHIQQQELKKQERKAIEGIVVRDRNPIKRLSLSLEN